MFNLVIHSGATHLKWNSLFDVIVNGSICNGNSAKRNAHFIKWHCCHYHKVQISLNISHFNWKRHTVIGELLKKPFSLQQKVGIVFLFLRNRTKRSQNCKQRITLSKCKTSFAQHNTCCNIINVRKTVKKPKHAMKANTHKKNLNVLCGKNIRMDNYMSSSIFSISVFLGAKSCLFFSSFAESGSENKIQNFQASFDMKTVK